jgi:hypothetical protein
MKKARLNKSRDDAIERVGRALYGQQWIGELKTREWKIGKFHGDPVTDLPPSGKSAAAIAAARFRSHGSDLQYAQVFRWLHKQKIECAPHEFDAAAFDVWFRRKFPHAQNGATASRVKAVRALLQKGHRPGRGGNVVWKKFCDLVRTTSAQRCDDKTIKRDVAAVRASG